MSTTSNLLPETSATSIEAEERSNRVWRLRDKKNAVSRNPSGSLTGLPEIVVNDNFRMDKSVWKKFNPKSVEHTSHSGDWK